MKTTEPETNKPSVQLIESNIERDVVLGVQWLEGELSQYTFSHWSV